MFTGIITHLGKIKDIEQKNNQTYFTIETDLVNTLSLGASVAVDGICLTVTELDLDSFQVQTIPETLRVTNLLQKKVGDKINLESALRLDQGIDGHLVQGHVDGVGQVVENIRKQDQNWILEIQPPSELLKYIAHKGSITINGVSLTVSKQIGETFEVSLIDYTLQQTDLSVLLKGDLVNLEVDLIARYLEKLTQKQTC
jgi:riboflavin synthase